MRLTKLPLCILTMGLSAIAGAVCPLCTLAVSAGVGLTQYLGIDDVITGLWLGGVLTSITLWSREWFKRGSGSYPVCYTMLLACGWFGSCYLTLWLTGHLGHPLNRLWGGDKLLLGGGIGACAFIMVHFFYLWFKHRYHRPLFPFQKVVMPLVTLLGLSLLFNEVVI